MPHPVHSPFRKVHEVPVFSHGDPDLRFNRSPDQLETPPVSGETIQFPFQLQDASAYPTAKINVRYGTMNDVVPTNVATNIDVADSSTVQFYLHLTVDLHGKMTAVALETGASQPADGDYDGYITLGQAISGAGTITTINQAATHSLRFVMCGRVVIDGTLAVAGSFQFWGF